MKSIAADDSTSLRRALRSELPTVGPRGPSREQDATEAWVAFHAVAALDLANLLSFPFTLSKHERPDFKLEMAKVTAGIEVSECIPEVYARAQAIADKKRSGKPLWRSAFEGLPNAVKTKDIERRVTSPPPTYGYTGDSMERLAAGDLRKSIDRKVLARSKAGFTAYPENWLLLYSNTGRTGLKFGDVLARLKASSSWSGPFSRLLVMHGQELAVSSGDRFSVLPVPDLGAA